ncbi:MAG: GldG family protein [Acidiferrobacterales bacterium]|nr:GldG family protein [Acidiferrobacterales bacterium]
MKITHLLVLLFCLNVSHAANIAYIYGDVAPDGTIPSGSADPYDQMLLTDSGDEGLSQFKQMVESEGHSISQFYDANTTLSASFLNSYEVVIFGLHQKQWSASEKNALDLWIGQGGGVLIYSDSASGGFYGSVGAQNEVGQTTTNNLIAQYGIQVTVDQANGNKDESGNLNIPSLSLAGLVLEGEGVSPVAVSNNSNTQILIPFTESVSKDQNITISNPTYAALALASIGDGHIAVMFDRQPMWNDGPGSDINEFDNKEILRRLINFLAITPVVAPPTPPPTNSDFVPVAPIQLLLGDNPD